MARPDTLQIPFGGPPDATVLWFHGLGADQRDFLPLPEAVGRPRTRYLLPNAPFRPISVYGGRLARGWFDLRGFDEHASQDEPGLDEAATTAEALIREEVARGIPESRIVVGGFSQGGTVALHAGLSRARPLAGLVGLSTYLSPATPVRATPTPPVYLAHGDDDPVIPVRYGRLSHERLTSLGVSARFSTYPIPHTVTAPELADLGRWLSALLANQGEEIRA